MIARLPGWQKKTGFSLFRSFFIFIFCLFSFSAAAFSNGLTVSNVSIVDRDADADTTVIEFDITWNNSWSDSINHDAAWIFFKYSTDSGTTWNHATLKTSGTDPSGFSDGTPSSSAYNAMQILVTSDKKGMFYRPAHQNSGTVNFTDVRAVWNYAADGVSDAQAIAAATSVKVFAYEMVYVPGGGFYFGDLFNGTAVNPYNVEFGGAGGTRPGAILDDMAIQFSTATTDWYYNTDAGANDRALGASFVVGDQFPKGFVATYVMKYEVTEQQWVDFFNTLTSAQKTTRDMTAAGPKGKNTDGVSNRNTIAWTTGNATTTRGDRAMCWLNWMHLAAFLDWSALRPMTEIEFEKFARGPDYPTGASYKAWESTSITACAAAGISGTQDGTETCGTANANSTWSNITFSTGTAGTDNQSGPTRAGMYATASTPTRLLSGGSYYGIMDLIGNCSEMVVSIGTANGDGLGFTGTNGDGVLTSTSSYEGNATNSGWPGLDATNNRGITGATGVGERGCSWADTTTIQCSVGARTDSTSHPATAANDIGGRGVRRENS